MSDNETAPNHRRVIVDVNGTTSQNKNQQPKQNHQGKRRRRHNNANHAAKPRGSGSAEIQGPIPLEMRPLIEAALGYGKRTYALGALSASKTLAQIAEGLRELADGHHDQHDIQRLLTLAENESKTLATLFGQAYDA